MNHAVAEEIGEVALNENPYLAGLTKKTRSLKKKMEKIRKTEELKEAGKNLNAEQLKLLETRPFVEAGLVEHERIRSAMEAVALDLKGQEMEEAKVESSTSVVATPTLSPDSIKALKGDANDGISTPSTDVDAPSEDSTMESVGVATDPIPIEHASAQTELSGPPPPRGLDPAKASIAMAKAAMYAAKEKEEAEARGLATGRAEIKTGLRKILGLLHATTWCNAKGKSLPTAIDFFSKVLLGQTVPPDESDFDDCLEQSVERAIMYLNPSNSSKDVAPGITFEKLDGMVNSLREDIIVDLTPKEPVFNFFPDLCPEELAKRDSVGSSEEPEGATPSLEEGNIKETSQRGSPVNHDLPPMTHRTPQDGQFRVTPPLRKPQVPSGDIKSQPSQSAAISDEKSPVNEAPPALVKVTSLSEPLPPRPLLTPATGDPSSMTRANGHSVIQQDVQSQSLISLGQQASQMEEGVLPPVVTQDEPCSSQVVIKEEGGELPKSKEKQTNRLQAPFPPPPICQGSSGGDAKTVSKTKVPSQPALRQQQVWSPLRRTTSAGYAGGWGYPRVSQDVQHAQPKSYRHPVHADPTQLCRKLNDETKRNVPAFPTPPHDASTPRDASRPALIANGDVKDCPTTISKQSPKKEENAPNPITAGVAKSGPAPTPPGLESSDQLSATPVVSEETSGKPRGGRNVKGGVLNPRSRKGKRVDVKGGGNKHSNDIPGFKPTANSLSNSPPQSPSVAIALREQGPVEHVQRKGDAEKNGRSRRPRERGRGRPSQKQEEDRRAEGKQLEAQGLPRNQAAQVPVQDNRRTAPQEMDRGALGLVKREAPTSSSTSTVPSKSPPQAPSSLSWARDVPSSSNQPLHDNQQQRGGRGRNRRVWQRKSSEQRMQGRESHQGPAPSVEAGIMQQNGRNGNNQVNVANGGRTGGRARNPSNMDVNGSNRAAFSGKHGRPEESASKAHTSWRSGYRKSGVP